MAAKKLEYDPYFDYAQPGRRHWYSKVAGVTKADVTCLHCNYITRSSSTDPRRAFRAHVRKHHPSEYQRHYRPQFIIQEQDDTELADVC